MIDFLSPSDQLPGETLLLRQSAANDTGMLSLLVELLRLPFEPGPSEEPPLCSLAKLTAFPGMQLVT